jgi:hypothetical protein
MLQSRAQFRPAAVLLPALFLVDCTINIAEFEFSIGTAVGVPSISAAYASVDRRDLPMATTSFNIVQRLGGPTFTTLCATVLG